MRIISRSRFSGTLPVWEREDVLAASEYVISALAPFATTPNRFHRYHEMLASDLLIRATDVATRRTVNDAYASTIQTYFACTILHRRPLPVETARRLISGTTGGNRSLDSTPWDAQFELFCMAMLQYAGLHDARYAEPDLIIPAGNEELGIAIKRITADGNKAIIKRIREAQRQLSRNQMRGCIALDVSGGHRLHEFGGQNCTLGPDPAGG